MEQASSECECGHWALEHDYDYTNDSFGKCESCDCKKFTKKVDPNLGPYDHVPT